MLRMQTCECVFFCMNVCVSIWINLYAFLCVQVHSLILRHRHGQPVHHNTLSWLRITLHILAPWAGVRSKRNGFPEVSKIEILSDTCIRLLDNRYPYFYMGFTRVQLTLSIDRHRLKPTPWPFASHLHPAPPAGPPISRNEVRPAANSSTAMAQGIGKQVTGPTGWSFPSSGVEWSDWYYCNLPIVQERLSGCFTASGSQNLSPKLQVTWLILPFQLGS